MSTNSNTEAMPSGNASPSDSKPSNDKVKADSGGVRDRGSKSLVKNLPVGPQRPANK
jgi:hypothetical protein